MKTGKCIKMFVALRPKLNVSCRDQLFEILQIYKKKNERKKEINVMSVS